jgi:hypothetical protein
MSDDLDEVTIQEAMNDSPSDDFGPDMLDEPVEPSTEPTTELAELSRLFERQRRELVEIIGRTIQQALKPQPRQPEEGEPPPMPLLPDGLGMNLEQVQNLLAEKHKIIVGLDDPVLMLVTVMNAFLAQENALIERHKTALAKVMADKTGEYVSQVKTVTDSLSASLSDVTLAAMQKTFSDHSADLKTHKSDIMWLSAIAAISAITNVVIFAIKAISG